MDLIRKYSCDVGSKSSNDSSPVSGAAIHIEESISPVLPRALFGGMDVLATAAVEIDTPADGPSYQGRQVEVVPTADSILRSTDEGEIYQSDAGIVDDNATNWDEPAVDEPETNWGGGLFTIDEPGENVSSEMSENSDIRRPPPFSMGQYSDEYDSSSLEAVVVPGTYDSSSLEAVVVPGTQVPSSSNVPETDEDDDEEVDDEGIKKKLSGSLEEPLSVNESSEDVGGASGTSGTNCVSSSDTDDTAELIRKVTVKRAEKKKKIASKKSNARKKSRTKEHAVQVKAPTRSKHKHVIERIEIGRVVDWNITHAKVSIILHVKYPILIRVAVSTGSTNVLSFNSSYFYKYPNGSNPFVECNNITSAINLKELRSIIETVLEKDDKIMNIEKKSEGTAIYCKSLRQIHLDDVMTTIDRPSNSPLGGGTRQKLVPICNDNDLRIAIDVIAFRQFQNTRDSRKNNRISSKILDLLVIYKKIIKTKIGTSNNLQPNLTQDGNGYITRNGKFLFILFYHDVY